MGLVSLKNLRKQFNENVVVPEFNLEIADGEFLSLLGPSGCGKTTILRMIAGLEDPTSGLISIGGHTVYDQSTKTNVAPEKRSLGMVFQSYAIWPHMTVLKNVLFPLECQGMGAAERIEKARAALKSVHLDTYAERKPNQLSGGQQQRVALARALVGQPKVLLLDEPLSNLDAILRDEMCEELKRLRKIFPVTMVYVTHDQKEANFLSDRIALLDKGELVQLGSPNDLKSQPANDFVRRFLRL